MTRDEKIARAVELRGEGVYLDEIATYLGVSRTTVVRWTNENYAEHSRSASATWKQRNRERNRARDRQHQQDTKTPCPWCKAPSKAAEACMDCRHAWHEVRRTLVEGMWAEGWSIKDLSAVLGVDAHTKTRSASWPRSHGTGQT